MSYRKKKLIFIQTLLLFTAILLLYIFYYQSDIKEKSIEEVKIQNEKLDKLGKSNYFEGNEDGTVYRVETGSGFSSDSLGNFNTGSVEMDFDSYHIRLIAKLIGYNLPETSIHDYLGKFYFGVDELTDAQRDESKAITFRLLYGGIDKEFLSIPFLP